MLDGQHRIGALKLLAGDGVIPPAYPVLVEVFQPQPPHADWPVADGATPGAKLLDFYNFYLSDEAHDHAFASAGFAAPVARHHLSSLHDISPDGRRMCPAGWWDELLEVRGANVYYVARAVHEHGAE